jgi:hypothetical protein
MAKLITISIPESEEELRAAFDVFCKEADKVSQVIRQLEKNLENLLVNFSFEYLKVELECPNEPSGLTLNIQKTNKGRIRIWDEFGDFTLDDLKLFERLSQAEYLRDLSETLKLPENIQKIIVQASSGARQEF